MYYTVDLKLKFFPIFLYRALLLKEINIVKKLQQPSNLLVKALSGIFLFKQENRIYQYFFLAASVYFSFGTCNKIPRTTYVLQVNKRISNYWYYSAKIS